MTTTAPPSLDPPATLPALEGPPTVLGAVVRLARSVRRPGIVVVEAALFLGFWQLAVTDWGMVSRVVLPPPSDVFRALVELGKGTLWTALAASGQHWAIGFGLAIAFGVVLGLLLGVSRIADRLLSPLLRSLYATPWISFLPMLVIWEGFGAAPIITLVFIAGFLPVALTTAAGVRDVDPTLIRAAEVFGAGRFAVYRKVMLPACVPYMFTGMRIGSPVSVVAMLVGEILGSSNGLGQLLAGATAAFQLQDAFAALLVMIACSAALLFGFRWAERRVALWREEGAA